MKWFKFFQGYYEIVDNNQGTLDNSNGSQQSIVSTDMFEISGAVLLTG